MREINFFGIFMTPMVAYLLIAMVIYLLVRYGLRKVDLERYFWHTKLVQFCLFLIILSLVVVIALI